MHDGGGGAGRGRTSKANAIPRTKSISACVWYWRKLNGNGAIWYATAGISSDGNTVLSCNINCVAAWSSFHAVCRGLSFHWNGKWIAVLIRKEGGGKGQTKYWRAFVTAAFSLAQCTEQLCCPNVNLRWKLWLSGSQTLSPSPSFSKEDNKPQPAPEPLYSPCCILYQKVC